MAHHHISVSQLTDATAVVGWGAEVVEAAESAGTVAGMLVSKRPPVGLCAAAVAGTQAAGCSGYIAVQTSCVDDVGGDRTECSSDCDVGQNFPGSSIRSVLGLAPPTRKSLMP
eukprot:scpid45781/ scgid8734/ 